MFFFCYFSLFSAVFSSLLCAFSRFLFVASLRRPAFRAVAWSGFGRPWLCVCVASVCCLLWSPPSFPAFRLSVSVVPARRPLPACPPPVLSCVCFVRVLLGRRCFRLAVRAFRRLPPPPFLACSFSAPPALRAWVVPPSPPVPPSSCGPLPPPRRRSGFASPAAPARPPAARPAPGRCAAPAPGRSAPWLAGLAFPCWFSCRAALRRRPLGVSPPSPVRRGGGLPLRRRPCRPCFRRIKMCLSCAFSCALLCFLL